MDLEIEEYSRVYAAVNLDAIADNMKAMKEHMNQETKIIAVIKTDGYGHGAIPIAKMLETYEYVFGYAVATPEEAMILRKSEIKKPILILGYTFPYSYEQLINYEIRPVVFKLETAELLSKKALELQKTAVIHIGIDTGMSRIGFQNKEESIQTIIEISKLPNIEIEGIFTHFAKSDETDKTSAKNQIAQFLSVVERLEQRGVTIPLKHCSNSAGIIDLKDANMNLVRAGISVYGLYPSDEVNKKEVKLTPALELISKIIYIKEIEAGTGVSYGSTFIADKKMKIATIPVGYGDGYPRGLSNKGYVLIRGKRAPILGRVCMDQFMVDISDIPDAAEYDRVVLIGKDGEAEIKVEELGELAGRFNYEFMCDLGKRIPRVYYKNGKIVDRKDYYNDL